MELIFGILSTMAWTIISGRAVWNIQNKVEKRRRLPYATQAPVKITVSRIAEVRQPIEIAALILY